MIITDDQVKELNSYLAALLKYQETVEEIADHIISSLEVMETDMPFWTAVLNVINNDFGSIEGLALMEKQSEKLVASNLRNSILNYLSAYFKFPRSLWLFALLLIFYHVQNTYQFTCNFLAIAFYSFAVIPSFMYLTRYFYSGYYSGSIKKSIKDKSIAQLGSWSIAIVNTLIMYPMILIGESQINDFIHSYPISVSLIFLLLNVYVFSFVQLNQTEIKRYMVRR